MVDLVQLVCVCDNPDCWCMNPVATTMEGIAESWLTTGHAPDIACSECLAGHHVQSFAHARRRLLSSLVDDRGRASPA
jgi:hypothetical protein